MLHALLKAGTQTTDWDERISYFVLGITLIINLAEAPEIEQQAPYVGTIERLIAQQPAEYVTMELSRCSRWC